MKPRHLLEVLFEFFDKLDKIVKKSPKSWIFGKLGKLEWAILASALGLVVLLCCLPFFPAQPFSEESIPFEVQQGQGVRGIARHLKDERLIVSPAAFTLLARFGGKDRGIKAGIYTLSPGQTPGAILALLEGGKMEAARLTIPEGYSLDKIARSMEAAALGKGERFLDHARADAFAGQFPFLRALPSGATLEGYLFPDTYYLAQGSNEVRLIEVMLKRFSQVVLPAWKNRSTEHLSFHEVITLASIVEREARIPSERPLIAGVFLNRLKIHMPLGSDPTVEYALGRHQDSKGLSLKDIKVDSPYNTYKYAGLPPGPIASPGLASIQAVLHPKSTPYLYFVARGDGSHHFSRTLGEQIQAQRRYQ